MVSFNVIRGHQYFVHDRKSRKMFHESINIEHPKNTLYLCAGNNLYLWGGGGSQGVVSSREHVSHGSVVTTCGGLWVWEYSLMIVYIVTIVWNLKLKVEVIVCSAIWVDLVMKGRLSRHRTPDITAWTLTLNCNFICPAPPSPDTCSQPCLYLALWEFGQRHSKRFLSLWTEERLECSQGLKMLAKFIICNKICR